MQRRRVPSAPVALLALALAACGQVQTPHKPAAAASSTPASSSAKARPAVGRTGAQPAQHLKKVTLRLGLLIVGPGDPMLLAKQRGYFRQAGLDVSIKEGKGSVTTGLTTANGHDQFGNVDAGTLAKLVSRGAPLKMLAVFEQETPIAFIHNPNVPFRTPKNLIGRPLLIIPGSAPTQILPAVLDRYGMTVSQLKEVGVPGRTSAQAFVHTPGSIMLGETMGNYQSVLKLDPKAQAVRFSKFGVNVLASGIVTSLSLIKHHPGEVRAFMHAAIRGWEAAQKDPTAAVEATVKAFPHASYAAQLGGLKAALKLLHTPASQGHVIGWMARSDWQNTLQTLHKYAGLKVVKPVSGYYTNSFLPSK